MAFINTAERVSREVSDNCLYQRFFLAYHLAAKYVKGNVLEIGTGLGYGVDIIASKTDRFVTLDKTRPKKELYKRKNVTFVTANVPPLPFPDKSFDFVVSFQVIEHIKHDKELVNEVYRVLRPGGKFIVSTPNRLMSLTRNPFHVREYTIEELRTLLEMKFLSINQFGIFGNDKVMNYYEKNRDGVRRITRFDFLNLQYRLPRCFLKIPYDIFNRINRLKLLKENSSEIVSITMNDYSLNSVNDQCLDLFYIVEKK